jgi:hypothetical protein
VHTRPTASQPCAASRGHPHILYAPGRAHAGFDYPRWVTNRSVGSANGAPAHGPGPGQPARVFTGATGRPERDRGSKREPEDWSHGRGHETRGCGGASL